jgi:hypothetical protein
MNPLIRGTVCLNWARTDLWGASSGLRVRRPYPGLRDLYGIDRLSERRVEQRFLVAFAGRGLDVGRVSTLTATRLSCVFEQYDIRPKTH